MLWCELGKQIVCDVIAQLMDWNHEEIYIPYKTFDIFLAQILSVLNRNLSSSCFLFLQTRLPGPLMPPVVDHSVLSYGVCLTP